MEELENNTATHSCYHLSFELYFFGILRANFTDLLGELIGQTIYGPWLC